MQFFRTLNISVTDKSKIYMLTNWLLNSSNSMPNTSVILTFFSLHYFSSGKDKKSVWTEHKAPDGRIYFYNTATRQSSWEKPDILKTPAEVCLFILKLLFLIILYFKKLLCLREKSQIFILIDVMFSSPEQK